MGRVDLEPARREWENDRIWADVEKKGLYLPGKGAKIRGARSLIKDIDFTSKTVLDIGCGTGWFGKMVRDRGAEVTGIDISEILLNAASFNIPVVKKASAYRLPFGDNSFDFTASLMVMQILSDPMKAITEMHRVLKAKGKAFVGIVHPNAEKWDKQTGLCSPDRSSDNTAENRPWVFNLSDGRRFTKNYIHRPLSYYLSGFHKLFDISMVHEPAPEEEFRNTGKYASREYLFFELMKK